MAYPEGPHSTTLCRMLDHISLQCRDVDGTARFYATVFAPIGVTEVMRFPHGSSWLVGMAGTDGQPRLWLGPVDGSSGLTTNREVHLAFAATSRTDVDAVHAVAVAEGVEVLHQPKEWPEYHPGYYAVFVRDPDGNNAEVVCHRPE